MRTRTILILLTATIIAGLLVWVTGRKPASPRGPVGPAAERNARVCPCAPLEVASIGISAGDLQALISREPGGWMLTKPLHAPADAVFVSRCVSVIEDLRCREVITAEQRKERRLELADYGLAAPRARIALDCSGGRPCEILIGHEAPLGGAVYVMLSGSGDVIATDGVVTNLIPPGLETLRDRAIARGDPARVSRIELHRKGAAFIKLARDNGGWKLQQPLVSPADPTVVADLLKAIFGMRVSSFVKDWTPASGISGDDTHPNAWVEPYGLARDETAVRLAIWDSGEETGREILFGRAAPDNTIYAMNGGMDSVVTVGTNILGHLLLDAGALRERRLLPIKAANVERLSIRRGSSRLAVERQPGMGWLITEPVQWAAEPGAVMGMLEAVCAWRAVAFHDGISTNEAQFGLNRPDCLIELEEAAADVADHPDRRPLRIEIGSVSAAARTVYVRFEGGDTVYEVPLHAVSALGENPADPLLYRARTVLALQADHVIGISLVKWGREQALVREDKGTWRATTPPGYTPNAETIGDVLFLVSNLRAIRMHSRSMEKVPGSGLERPGVSLTLTLDGEGGIQKTLVLGAPSRSDGVFAAIRGGDVVYVLAEHEADRLMRDLCVTPAETKP